MPQKSTNNVVTEVAPCGLLCARCESFIAKKCKGCYVENTKGKMKCPVLEKTPFEESKELIACMANRGVEKCNDCEIFEDCEVYETLLFKCPFKRPIYDLKPGFGYLIKEKKPDLSFKVFTDFIKHGSEGLCMSTQHPKNLQKILGRNNIEIYWLTSLEGKDNIDPTNIGILSDSIIRFIKDHKNPVMILDGIELLITNNGFQKVLRMVNHITDQVMQSNARFIIPIDERTLDKKEQALLERNLEVVGG